jgi:hypothetical protein
VNGIDFIDVLLASGFDYASADYGNEPSLTANPLNPNQIVLTSFSGSSWAVGGNSTLFYSGDGGATWSYLFVIPPPTGTTTNINCPCDQTVDWGRDGQLYATFLHYDTGAVVQSVYSAQTPTPNIAASWVYRTIAGVAQKTNLPAMVDVDQPWLWSGPLDTDNARTNVSVVYDNFDAGFINEQTRAADSPAFNPMDFTRDQATNVDGQQYNDGMNPGNRLAIGPEGRIYTLYQRLVTSTGTVKELTYLINASSDGGQTWSVANSDHPSGAKIVAANVLSFQGNGSKVGGVNALLGGITAINVDPATGTAWVVFGRRLTATSRDLLYLVPVTSSGGSLLVGTARLISPGNLNSYLPAVAVLPNGEVGVLFLTYDGISSYTWRLVQTINGGVTLAKSTILHTFTSPFTNNGSSNQRIFGDYIQLKAAGCEFFGAYPSRGTGVNSISSIDPYFMRAPSFPLGLSGSGFLNGAIARVQGTGRTTTYSSAGSVSTTISAAEIASPGSLSVQVLNAHPAGGLTGTLSLPIDAGLPGSPGASLLVTKGGGNVSLAWNATAQTHSYYIFRCNASSGPCAPLLHTESLTNGYMEATLADGNDYWYLIRSINGCGGTL